jgi:hypothetical protein
MPSARIARHKFVFDMDALVDALEHDPEKPARIRCRQAFSGSVLAR